MEITLQDLPILTLLERVRKAIIRSLLGVALLAVVGWFLTEPAIQLIVGLYEGLEGLVYVNVAENFLTRLKLAVVLGFVFAAPWILWQLYTLFSPWIGPGERRLTLRLLVLAVLLFYGGLAFAFFAVLPLALRFFLSFGGTEVEPLIRLQSMVNFVITFTLPFALIFQLPVILYFLGRIGILTAEGLRRFRKYNVLVSFIVAAVLTPADVFSQLMMAIPVLVLYEVSILLVARAGRGRS